MKPYSFVIIMMALVVILLLNHGCQNYDEKDIRAWAQKNKVQVTEVERCYFMSGPYYIAKNRRIYKVTASDGTYWFRYGNLFSNDIEKESASGYIKIQ